MYALSVIHPCTHSIVTSTPNTTHHPPPRTQELFSDGPALETLHFCESSMRFFKHKSELARWLKKLDVCMRAPY